MAIRASAYSGTFLDHPIDDLVCLGLTSRRVLQRRNTQRRRSRLVLIGTGFDGVQDGQRLFAIACPCVVVSQSDLAAGFRGKRFEMRFGISDSTR